MNLLHMLRQAGQSVTRTVRRLVNMVKGWVTRVAGTARRAADRHRERVSADAGYTRTVATAVTELVAYDPRTADCRLRIRVTTDAGTADTTGALTLRARSSRR